MTAERKNAIEQKIAQLSGLCQRNDLACQYGDLISQYSGLKEKWYSLFQRKKLESIDEEFDKLDKEFERIIDEELMSAILSSCRVAQLSPVQEHGFRVLRAALRKSESYISNWHGAEMKIAMEMMSPLAAPFPWDLHEKLEALDKKLGDDMSAMKILSAEDTPTRKEWFKSFMGSFKHLSLSEGWRLSAMTRYRGDGRWAKFFVTNDNGEFCENPLDRMSVSGDPVLGSIEAAMFDFVITQVDLYWHALYNKGWVVQDIPTLVQEHPDVRSTILKIAESEDMRKFCDYDFLPSVTPRKGSGCLVRYVKCHDGGFSQLLKIVKTTGYIGNIWVPLHLYGPRFGDPHPFMCDPGFVY